MLHLEGCFRCGTERNWLVGIFPIARNRDLLQSWRSTGTFNRFAQPVR